MSRLGELIDAVRAAGLLVSLTVTGHTAELSPSVDLTAYRIIQEALTNALRHAPGSAASVRLAYGTAHVTVDVANAPAQTRPPGQSGPPARMSVPAGGYGLAGIAERVTSCGGSLTLGPAAGGGFTVSARLPLI